MKSFPHFSANSTDRYTTIGTISKKTLLQLQRYRKASTENLDQVFSMKYHRPNQAQI